MITTGILLTKSYKDNGFCVTVYDENKSIWRLLIDENPKSAIPKSYLEGIELLDRIEFDVIKKCELAGPQSENLLICKKYGIKKIGKYQSDIVSIYNSARKNPTLVFNSTDGYITKRNLPNYSILLLKVTDLNIYQLEEINDNGELKTKTYANFSYEKYRYMKFSVTTPEYKNRGKFLIKEACVLISLPPAPYSEGSVTFYKFIAAVYPLKKLKDCQDKAEDLSTESKYLGKRIKWDSLFGAGVIEKIHIGKTLEATIFFDNEMKTTCCDLEKALKSGDIIIENP